MTAPPKSLLDKSFRYVPAARTDLSRTFARIRKELREAQRQREATPDAEGRVIRMKALARKA